MYLDSESSSVYGLMVTGMEVTDTRDQSEPILVNGCHHQDMMMLTMILMMMIMTVIAISNILLIVCILLQVFS